MVSELIKVSLKIKSDKTSYTNSNIIKDCSNDGLVQFAEAYNSLQLKEADMFIKKSEYLITV